MNKTLPLSANFFIFAFSKVEAKCGSAKLSICSLVRVSLILSGSCPLRAFKASVSALSIVTLDSISAPVRANGLLKTSAR